MSGDLDLVRRLAAADHGLAVVATTRSDGTVHASVVNAGLLDDPITKQPAVGFVTAGSALKISLLRRTGRATVVLRGDGSGWPSKDRPAGSAQTTHPTRSQWIAYPGCCATYSLPLAARMRTGPSSTGSWPSNVAPPFLLSRHG